MTFVSAGADVALQRIEATGKFDLVWDTSGKNAGNPRFDDTRTHSVLGLLLSQKYDPTTQQGGYFWDKTGRRGTYLYKVRLDLSATPSLLKSYGEDGGQQLLDRRLVQTFFAEGVRIRPGRLQLQVRWTVPSGSPPPQVVTP